MEWGYLIGILRCGELAPAQAPFLFVSGPAGGRVRARLPAKSMNSVFEREPRAGKKEESGPAGGRVRARQSAKPMNSVLEREPRA